MVRSIGYGLVLLAAGLALLEPATAAEQARPAAAAEQPKPAAAAERPKQAPQLPRGFYRQFLTPRVDSRLNGEIGAATEYVSPTANPWTRDDRTVGRIEVGVVRAMKSAVKAYALQSLRLDTWAVTLLGTSGAGAGPLRAGAGDTRLRFGIAHLTPRADVSIPSSYGRVIFSADLRGRVATSFDSHSSNFSLEVSYDPPERSGGFSLIRRF